SRCGIKAFRDCPDVVLQARVREGKTVIGSIYLSTESCGGAARHRAVIPLRLPDGRNRQPRAPFPIATTRDAGAALSPHHPAGAGARILLVEAKSAAYTDLLSAVDYAAQHAQVVSMSWGGSEFLGEGSYDAHFSKTGVTFFAASGDSGAGVEWPAVSPSVVSVG